MTGFIVRRVVSMLVTFVLISIVIFLMMHAIPGGPFDGNEMPLPDNIKARLMATLGLDKPLWEQYLRYMWGVLHLDFGVPFQSPGETVMGLVAHAWVPSIVLGGCGILIGAPIGILLGMAASLRRNSWIDYLASAVATLGLTVPVFVISTLLILVFAVWLKWTPASGWGEPKRWILPILAYAAVPLATYARYARATMLDALNKPFVTVLRAKGLSERRIVFQHVLRNAAIPMVTIFPAMFVGIATGSIFVEAMFRVPGLGAYFVSSINKRDYPLEMALMLLISGLYSVSYLLADILYAVLNPRIRVEGGNR
ncbi:MAG TPA: ABC transporter permease [Devosia sp.]|jgi:ABC-type dipeptide/oligopeptide/nickel transport system permease component|nr:ABC transporter permease [Devosia sp.]